MFRLCFCVFLERQVCLRLEDSWKCARTPTKRCDERGRRKSRRNEETVQVNNDLHHHKVPHLDGAAVRVCLRTPIPDGLRFGSLSSPLT